MIRARIVPVIGGALFAALFGSGLLGSGTASGVVPPAAAAVTAATAPALTFQVRYFAEGGSYQTYLLAKRGAGVAGEAWLDAEAYDGRRVRSLTVCDRVRDGVAVRARILVGRGRWIEYLAPVGPPCFVRDLGYPIVRWQLSVGVAFSGQVAPPILV